MRDDNIEAFFLQRNYNYVNSTKVSSLRSFFGFFCQAAQFRRIFIGLLKTFYAHMYKLNKKY